MTSFYDGRKDVKLMEITDNFQSTAGVKDLVLLTNVGFNNPNIFAWTFVIY